MGLIICPNQNNYLSTPQGQALICEKLWQQNDARRPKKFHLENFEYCCCERYSLPWAPLSLTRPCVNHTFTALGVSRSPSLTRTWRGGQVPIFWGCLESPTIILSAENHPRTLHWKSWNHNWTSPPVQAVFFLKSCPTPMVKNLENPGKCRKMFLGAFLGHQKKGRRRRNFHFARHLSSNTSKLRHAGYHSNRNSLICSKCQFCLTSTHRSCDLDQN